LLSTVTSSNNQLPNMPDLTPQFALGGVSQYPSSNINNLLNFRDEMEILALNGTPSANLQWQVAYTAHNLRQDFLPDPTGQLIYTGVAARTSNGNQDQTLQAAYG